MIDIGRSHPRGTKEIPNIEPPEVRTADRHHSVTTDLEAAFLRQSVDHVVHTARVESERIADKHVGLRRDAKFRHNRFHARVERLNRTSTQQRQHAEGESFFRHDSLLLLTKVGSESIVSPKHSCKQFILRKLNLRTAQPTV
jgi:hypothetical protein